jgi:hypothetical protein
VRLRFIRSKGRHQTDNPHPSMRKSKRLIGAGIPTRQLPRILEHGAAVMGVTGEFEPEDIELAVIAPFCRNSSANERPQIHGSTYPPAPNFGLVSQL